ncbi:hypothetical protein [Foetidibacter luteolus]|uniref:hypothetical protein n=1 Tax=Foetidibacter luteolus TaxID=2608880 RepID=UPI00129B43BA|nr:hypothetical protein [Foetidibacter luteolus]
MYGEAKKLYLIEAILKVEDERILNELEWIIKKDQLPAKKLSAMQFVGSISGEDVNLIEKAIEEGCEQIDSDGWK